GLLEGVSLRRIHYIAYVRATLAIIVKDDDVVYHGLVGHLLIKGAPHIFRVRVIADMEFRIKAAVDQHGFSRENAIRLIKKVDCDRARWVRSIYHVDWQDPSLYDLVVDLEHASISNACDMVVEAVETKFQTTPESQKAIDDFVVSTEVRARIAADRGIEDTEVEIEADGDVVTIDGKADSMGEANRIMRVVRETPGIREVKSDLRVRTSGQKDGG
ncbi:MAG: BON domain-containing protein, partial [Chloroflexi bacterium]|nr:BON domain-containing protein [Chloroflexota bacterium]